MNTINLTGKYYPTTEKILLGAVDNKELWNFISKGFALTKLDGINIYVSYNFIRPNFVIESNPTNDSMMAKNSDEHVIRDLTRLSTKIKFLQIHYGDTEKSWNKLKALLDSDEYKRAISSYPVTIQTLISFMLPSCPLRLTCNDNI